MDNGNPNTIREIYTDKIDDPEFAMRTDIDRDGLFDLAENIKQNGLINPITIRPKGERFEVVAGHRRLSACKIAGLIRIPCVVRDLDDNRTFEVMAAENLERADVDPVDEAIFISRYLTATNKTIPEVAKAIKRSIAYVEARLAVGQMPDYMRDYIKTGQLKLGAALALAQIEHEPTRRVWVEQAVRDGVSVAQAEYWLYGWKKDQLPGAVPSETPPDGFVAGESQPMMFRCFVDGKNYNAKLFRTVLVYEGNLSLLNEIVAELQKTNGEN